MQHLQEDAVELGAALWEETSESVSHLLHVSLLHLRVAPAHVDEQVAEASPPLVQVGVLTVSQALVEVLRFQLLDYLQLQACVAAA